MLRQPIKLSVIVLALASVLQAGAVRADFSAVGPWVAGGSFYQGFQYNNLTTPVDLIAVTLNVGGPFEPPAIRDVNPTPDWGALSLDPSFFPPTVVALAAGSPATHVDFKLWFVPNTPTNETVMFKAWNGSTVVETVSAWYDGTAGAWMFGPGSWSVTRAALDGAIITPAVPVPGAALLGIAGLGLVGFVRRRLL